MRKVLCQSETQFQLYLAEISKKKIFEVKKKVRITKIESENAPKNLGASDFHWQGTSYVEGPMTNRVVGPEEHSKCNRFFFHSVNIVLNSEWGC